MPRIGFRFSLRVLIYTALLIASAMWLVDAWPPWKLERTFGGHIKFINALAFSPDGRRLFSGGEDGALHSISMEDGTRWIATGANPDTIRTISVSPDSTRVFAGGSQQTGSMWDVATSKKLFTLEKSPGEISASAFAPDGSFLVTATNAVSAELGGIVRIWNAREGTLRKELIGHQKAITGVAVSPDSQLIYSGSADETMRIWSVKDGVEIFQLKTDLSIERLALRADGLQLVYSRRFSYHTWDTVTRQNVALVMDTRLGGVNLNWSGDSKRMLRASTKLQIRDETESNWTDIWPEAYPSGNAILSPDGKRIAFLTTPNTIGILVNQRPESWYGIFYLPAFWLTLLIAAALLRTILAERNVLAESA